MQTTSTLDSLDELGLLDLARMAVRRWRVVLASAVAGGAVAFGLSMLVTPQFTAKITFLPPQSSSGIGLALQSLGPLASLATGGVGGKASGDLYVSFLGSETILDRMVARFKLRQLYKADYEFKARDILKNRTHIGLGKRDGLITIEVDDTDPKRAAAMATQYVDELRDFASTMTLTEAQRKRAFFQSQLDMTRKNLVDAQTALQASGFNQGALRSEPRAAAEEYARIMEELTATEVQQSALSSRLTGTAPEMLHLQATAAALRARLDAIEKQSSDPAQSQDYVGKYRDFKYQETLYDALAKQFESARLEEGKDDNLVQVVDPAQVPEWKSKPKRSMYAIVGMLLAGLLASIACIVADTRRHAGRAR